jgi:hypothetical protein
MPPTRWAAPSEPSRRYLPPLLLAVSLVSLEAASRLHSLGGAGWQVRLSRT